MRIRQIVREYFTFSKTEKRGLWLLGTLLLLSAAIPPIVRSFVGPAREPLKIQNVMAGASEADSAFTEKVVQFRSFDPNRVSEEDLKSMGIPDFVIRNWMKYRKAGGKFFYRDDVLALYGMDKETYLTLRKYIDIPKPSWSSGYKQREDFALEEPIDINTATVEELQQLPGIGAVYSERIVKYRSIIHGFDSVKQLEEVYGLDEETLSEINEWLVVGPKPVDDPYNEEGGMEEAAEVAVLDLNTADSAALVSLRGIGPVYARRILEYRESLGGFNSKSQLLEVYGFPPETYESLQARLKVGSQEIRRINLNEASSKELADHPYISTALANFIVSYRMNHNGFSTVDELKQSFLVDDELFRKLNPYISL